MPGDELVRCRCCGGSFLATRPPRGPLAAYCSKRCRQSAYRARVFAQVATEAADMALASTHARLAVALTSLSLPAVTQLRDVLREPLDRNLSRAYMDGLCSGTTTEPGGVVAPLHNEE